MLNWHLGTIGFSYKDWNAVFYPVGLQPRDYLAHYSQIFNAVELDSTFYGTPKPEYVERWARVTPPEFTFCVKAPKEITHEMRLVGVEGLLDSFLATMRLLGQKLGVILFQLPPDFTHQFALPLCQCPGSSGPRGYRVQPPVGGRFVGASFPGRGLRRFFDGRLEYR